MIKEFVEVWDNHKEELREKYSNSKPDSYSSIVVDLVEMLNRYIDEYEKTPDPNRITTIDHGDYQGYLLWIVGSNDYQPSSYWAFSSYYGSCSGCDTFEAIQTWGDETTKEELDGYMTLALHILQSAREI